MAGTQKGGKAAAETNKTRHGSDFYARIGATKPVTEVTFTPVLAPKAAKKVQLVASQPTVTLPGKPVPKVVAFHDAANQLVAQPWTLSFRALAK